RGKKPHNRSCHSPFCLSTALTIREYFPVSSPSQCLFVTALPYQFTVHRAVDSLAHVGRTDATELVRNLDEQLAHRVTQRVTVHAVPDIARLNHMHDSHSILLSAFQRR